MAVSGLSDLGARGHRIAESPEDEPIDDEASISAQLRRAAFPGRCATSGRVIRVAANGFLAELAAGTFARRVESLYPNRGHGNFGYL